MYPSNLRLQTHDRSLVDNRIPNRVKLFEYDLANISSEGIGLKS